MRPIYQAENLFDAHLLRGRLAAEGVESFVQGEYLAGAIGELPLSGLVTVCVADADLDRAMALIAQWQSEPSPMLADDAEYWPDADPDTFYA